MSEFFSKKLFFVLGFIIIIMMFFTYPNVSAGAYAMQGSKVTFYGADNKTPIYNVNVPYGYSLNDLENANLLSNSFFNDFTTSSNSFNTNNVFFFDTGIDSWVGSRIFSYYISDSLYYSTTINNSFLSQFIEPVYNSNYYLNICVDDIVYNYDFTFNLITDFSVSQNIAIDSVSHNGVYLRLFHNKNENWHFDMFFTEPGTYKISFVYLGFYDFPYYNIDYVNHLYTISGETISDSKNWSQSQVNSLPYKFEAINQPNADLYYVNKSYSYDVSTIFNTSIKKLSNVAFSVPRVVQNLNSSWNKFNNTKFISVSFFDVLFRGGLLDVFKQVGSYVLNIIQLLFTALSIPIYAIIDLTTIVVTFLIPSNSWFYLT